MLRNALRPIHQTPVMFATSARDASARRSKITAPCCRATSRAVANDCLASSSVAAEREQAFAAQAVDFRQIKAHAGFIRRGDGGVKVRETSRGPARGEQSLGRQTEII